MNTSHEPQDIPRAAAGEPATPADGDREATDEQRRISGALASLRATIEDGEQRYQREPGSVRLLAVSKKKPVSAIAAALAAGQQAFGENYLDEALEKMGAAGLETVEWHFIGAIQSRKTTAIAEHFHWVHSVDRLKVARRLSTARPAGLPALNICVQVNIDDEDSKAGVSIAELDELIEACAGLPGLKLRGLMSIPAPTDDFQQQRSTCARLREHFDRLAALYPQMDTLSMGMSSDLEAAIAEGSTLVRVGTALFGAREQ